MNKNAIFVAIGYTYDMGRGGSMPQLFEDILGTVHNVEDGRQLIECLGFREGVVKEIFPALPSSTGPIRGQVVVHNIKIEKKPVRKARKAA